MKYQIDMPEGWKPSVCVTSEYICPSFDNGACANEDGNCPLASAVEVEPLAELAHKKGFSSISFQRDWECEPLGIKDGIWHYSLYMHQSHLGRKPLSKGFSTYAECEAKARSYLNGLTDAAGKGDN